MPQLIEPSTGKLRDVADKDVAGAIAAGWTPESQSDVERLSTGAANELNYGGVGGGVNAALAGIARGATLGASDVAASALGGQDATTTLEGLRAQNPYTSGASEFAGMLLPAVLTGGAATPAGIAATIGRRAAAGATREGAGVLGRVAGHAIGAAAEGSLYGGGQYLSETALENKPLSAEGFVGGMGKGALFAAPVGGAFGLAGETLMRARSLFPRSEVTAEAAAAVKSDASAAIRESLTDGDAMAATARQKIEMADAQAGAAGARTQVTRRVFGGGEPTAMGAHVDATANKAQLVEALGKLETSQAALKDWIAAGGDIELETSLAGLEAPGVQTRPGVPVGEFGAPGKGGIKSPEEISRAAAEAGVPESAASGASVAPTEPAPATAVLRKGSGSAPARSALDDIGAAPSAAEPTSGRAPSLDDIGGRPSAPSAVESTRVLRGAAPAEHAADDVTREAISSMGEEQLNKLQDSINEQFKHVKPGDPEHKALSDLMDQVQDAQRPFFDKRFGSPASESAPHTAGQHGEDMLKLHQSLAEFERVTGETIPAVEAPASLFKEHGYYEPPGGHTDVVRSAKARTAMSEGQREPISVTVSPTGKLLVNDGRHRLAAAIEADVPIEVKWSTGSEPAASDVLRHGAPAVEQPVAAAATDTLTGLLRGTKAKLDEGANLNDIGAPARGEYAAGKAERTAAAREHFRGEANAKNFAGSEMGAAERAANPFLDPAAGIKSSEDLDKFFRDLSAPKTRDAYVAANIGRAMREEGSHAAALAKVEGEWTDRAAAEAWAERAATLEYEGGYSRADAERIASHESNGPGLESARPNPKRTAAARKAAAASVERRREIHSAVASNLPQELQSTWDKEGYKFLQEEAPRIRGMKDRINAASKISESFTEKYGSPSETLRGYEGDRYHRRAEIEAKHAESWADEQERKHYAAGAREPASQATSVGERPGQVTPDDAKLTDLLGGGERPALPEARGEIGKMFGIDMAPEVAGQVGTAGDLKALLSQWSDSTAETAVDRGMRARMGTVADDAAIERLLQKRAGKNVDIGPQLAQAAKLIGDHEAASSEVAGLLGADAPKTAMQRAQAYQAARAAQAEAQGASAAKAAQGIQDRAVPAMGSSRTEVSSDVAKALQKHESAIEGAKDRALVSMQRAETKAAAKAAATPVLAPTGGIGSKLADVGTALEVMKALGVHVPVLSAIPVIGPVLGLFFKARAALSILGRKGGSIGRSTEGMIAATSAATRERLATATQAILTGAGKGALKLSEISAGPAVTLGYKLFPGPGITKSKDPVKLYEARMDEIARAQQPGAIDHAMSDRYQTGDPNLHDAMVAQVQRGIAFLDSKAPKPTILQSMLPGDGVWRPSKAQLDEWGKYVHAVGDPASVLEDLAKGHVTLEGAETLRVVYPELFAEGQRLLLQAAPQMQKSLPYPTRVAISILYRIPVDGSMQPGHLQYLQQGQGGGAAPSGGPPGASGPGVSPPASPPSLTGPIKLGQSTMTSLDHRAGS